MILVFSETWNQNLSSQFFDLAIENLLGGGTLAKFEHPRYLAPSLVGAFDLFIRKILTTHLIALQNFAQAFYAPPFRSYHASPASERCSTVIRVCKDKS
jgi:hypothetical protein